MRTFATGLVLVVLSAQASFADAFCDKLKVVIAASDEQPRPFMSLLKGEFGETTGLGWVKWTLPGFSQCYIKQNWYSRTAGQPWKYHCDDRVNGSLRMNPLAERVKACLGVEEILREDIDVQLGMPGQSYTPGPQTYGTPLITIMDRSAAQSYVTLDIEVFRKTR